MFDDLVSLLYPAYCYRCGDRLHKKQKYFCYGCEDLLPLHSNDNPLSGIFHERMFNKLELSQAFSYFNYQKSGPIQELIHDFKYAGIKQIGAYYGHKLALDISQTILYKPDLIIPVPLHKKKLRSRGYNQAQIIGEALGQTLQVPILLYGVHKRADTLTQTKLSRLERWKNTKDSFQIDVDLKQKHVLLVDDVFTTGSTLEAFGKVCLNVGCGKISIATLGIAV